MALGAGSRVGAYEILAALGAGGMGEVYRARDTRLGRDIALKVLPDAVTADSVRLERFDREARTIAALNHPHIVTIFSTEEAGGIRFFTMELVDGPTLDALIPSGGLPLARFLELAIPIADAVTAAHQKQITHRDLKPGNVMVSGDGRVKVLDFGLARIAEREGDRAGDATRAVLTHEGTIVGTMPYMSPEQIEGRALDYRTDLFSLGVMFYEMLSGVRPFQGESSALLTAAILRDVPRPLSDARSDLPEALVRLVSRCLEKRPEDRVQTARDVYNELRQVQRDGDSGSTHRSDLTGAAAARPAGSFAIAVMPFSVRGEDADAEAIAEGLTEDITAGLSKFSYLSVVTAHSVQQGSRADSDARQIGETLRARYLLEGGIRRSGETLRITTRLIDTDSGAQLWSETYHRNMGETTVVALQDDVTDCVVATVADLHGVLLRAMSRGLDQTRVEGLGPTELYLRYCGYHRQHSLAEHAILRHAFEQLVSKRPTLAWAWAALAHLYCHEHAFLFNELPDPLARARRALGRALELDAVDQPGWEALALTYYFERDPEGFSHAAERALALNSRNANTLAWMGTLFAHMGDLDRGCAITQRAMRLNPDHPGWYHFAFAVRHYQRGEFGEALQAAKRINMPNHLWAHWVVATAAGQLGRRAEAQSALAAFFALAPELRDENALIAALRRWAWHEDPVAQSLDGYRKAAALCAER